MNYFSDREFLTLLRSLTNVTKHGQLKWKRAGKHEFEAVLDETSFLLFTRDNDGFEPFAIMVMQNSDEIENISQDSMDDDATAQLSELYSVVRNKTLGIDQVVKGILSKVKGLEEEPPF